MTTQKAIQVAKKIYSIFIKYENLSGITFETLDYNDMNFCIVHCSEDSDWNVSVHPNGLFGNGSVEICSDGRVVLTFKTTPEKAWNLATEELQFVYKKLKAKAKTINEEEVKRIKEERIADLETSLKLLKQK